MSTRHPWQKRKDSPKRLTGRALQARNFKIKLRDQWTCQVCKRITDQLEVDHIERLADSHNDDPSNLQAICLPCHEVKTRTESGAKPVIGCDLNGYPPESWRQNIV